MKRLITIICMTISVCTACLAQQDMKVSLDPQVRRGTLPNGLTYYLRHNEWPKKRADFYIAQKVGSMQEEDNQRGLAHFLEHMCFNGTKNFPGSGVGDYLRSIGLNNEFNAYTSFDQTVYNINNVNVETPGALDSVLLILHDWSHDLQLTDKEIDKERGVINEEWRMRRSAMMRIYEDAFPVVHSGSKYAHRLPIGTMEVVNGFAYQTLRDYYAKWYRPDLQAVIIVGDIDVDAMEAKIQSVFADIKAVENPAVREYYPVPMTTEPIVYVGKDKEQTHNIIRLLWKTEATPNEVKDNIQYYLAQYAIGAAAGMFEDRISEMLQKPNPPFIQAGLGYGYYLEAKTMEAFQGVVVCEDNKYEESVKALYREILRAKKYGFTASEYERYKSEYLSQLQKQYDERDKVINTNYVEEYVDHFIDCEPAPGIEWEYSTMNAILPQLPVELVNSVMQQMPDSGLVVFAACPDKEGLSLPTQEQILAWMSDVDKEDIQAYTEEVNNDPLISKLPKAGKVKKIEDGIYDSRVITLSNGVKVYVKTTDYSPGQITLLASSKGGNSLYSEDEYINASNADNVNLGGWGTFSATDLVKRLAGIQASTGVSIGNSHEQMNGHCVKKDFETLLQLVHLGFTAPRKDQDAFDSFIQRQKAAIANQELQPTVALVDTIRSVFYDNNVRARRTKAEDLDKIDYDRMIEIYKERFADANDFTFFIVGDVNADSIAPLLAKYIGSLPVLKTEENYKDISLRCADGEKTVIFEKEQQTPNSITLFYYHTPMEYNLKNRLCMLLLQNIMSMSYFDTVREDNGGAYGIGVNADLDWYPIEEASIQFQLPTAPEKRVQMTDIIYQGVKDMVDNGPSADYFNKAKEGIVNAHDQELKRNGNWASWMASRVLHGHESVEGYNDILQSITLQDIHEVAKKLFTSGNRIEVGMTSKK